jgi:cytochrome c553
MKISNLTFTARLALVAAGALCLTHSSRAADVGENWNKHCASCHGKDGVGKTKMGAKLNIKDLTDAKFQDSFTDEAAFKAVREGIKDKDGKVRMKPIEALSDDEINALVKQVRALKK